MDALYLFGARTPRHPPADDLIAVELFATLVNRFGTTDRPPPPLLRAIARLRHARIQEQLAVAAQDHEAAKLHHDEQLRLRTDAAAQLEAWRRHEG